MKQSKVRAMVESFLYKEEDTASCVSYHVSVDQVVLGSATFMSGDHFTAVIDGDSVSIYSGINVDVTNNTADTTCSLSDLQAAVDTKSIAADDASAEPEAVA